MYSKEADRTARFIHDIVETLIDCKVYISESRDRVLPGTSRDELLNIRRDSLLEKIDKILEGE